MLDLLITTISIFFAYILFFCCIKFMRIFILILLLIPNFIIITILYSDNSGNEEDNEQPFHKTDFLPIKSIKGICDGSENLKDLDLGKTDGIYSIVKDDEYSKECLHNYFIKDTSECPMTDIILENTQVTTHSNYIEQKICNDMYLYYKRENNLDGKLYEMILYKSDSEYLCNGNNEFKANSKCYKIESNFNSKDVSSIVESEEQKKSTPITSLRNYANYSDKICILLTLLSIGFNYFEPFEDKEFNVYKIIDWVCQIFVLLLLSIRFHKYRKTKEFISPHKAFNLETIPTSISINIFIYGILYLFIPKKWKCKKPEEDTIYYNSSNDYINSWKKKLFAFLLPLFLIFCFMILFDAVNDLLIIEDYQVISCNWNQNSVKSILADNSFSVLDWEDIYIKYSLNEYNYFDISKKSDNSKICGKDSQGNDLYFPKDVECPINDIFVSKVDSNDSDYTKVQLNNEGEYLYYTNKKTTGKILIALISSLTDSLKIYEGMNRDEYNKISEDKDLKEKIERFNNIFFYEEIDRWYRTFENVPIYEYDDDDDDDYYSREIIGYRNQTSLYKLYAIHYLGVNNKLIGKVKGFGENLDKYDKLASLKYISYAFYFFDFIYYSCIFLFDKTQNCFYCFGIFFLPTVIYFIIINFWCLHINITYVAPFLNKINIDFGHYKYEYVWNILLTLIGLIFSIYFVFILVLGFKERCDCPKKEKKTAPISTNEVVIRYEQTEKSDSKEKFDKIFKDKKGNEPTCVLCLINKATIVLDPCRHKCVCETCFNDIYLRYEKKCPICQENFVGKIE